MYRSIRFNFFRPTLVLPTKNNICYVATVFFSLHECFLSRLNKNKSSYMNQVFVRCCRRNEIVIQEWICTWIYSTLLECFCKIVSRELTIYCICICFHYSFQRTDILFYKSKCSYIIVFVRTRLYQKKYYDMHCI